MSQEPPPEVRPEIPIPGEPLEARMMRHALHLARRAEAAGDVPCGAVVAMGERLLGYGFNRREALQLPTRHAELEALDMAAAALGTWRLHGCTLYVTKEPCVMCSGALVLARIDRVVYGAPDPKGGCCRSLHTLPEDPRFNHRVEIVPGVLEAECAAQLTDFFRAKRAGAARHAGRTASDPGFPGEVAERPNALDSKSSKPA